MALRPQHWSRTSLVIIPLAAGTPSSGTSHCSRASAMAFAAFSLCAAGQYVLNDLFDLEADRGHPSKRDARLLPES